MVAQRILLGQRRLTNWLSDLGAYGTEKKLDDRKVKECAKKVTGQKGTCDARTARTLGLFFFVSIQLHFAAPCVKEML